jgi:hypothetical protein
MTLTRNQYYEESGINVEAAKTEARKLTHSRVAHEAPLRLGRKLSRPQSSENTMLGNEQADFDATYNSRNALGDKFSPTGKLRSKDRFISSSERMLTSQVRDA